MCELDANQSTDAPAVQAAIPVDEQPAGAINLGDVIVWPVPDTPDAYHFLPLTPSIVRNSDGSEQVSLIDAGSVAFLQMATQFTVADDRIEAIRADLEESAMSPVRLSFAPLSEVVSWINIGDDVKTYAPSQMPTQPPYNALFNAQLDQEIKAIVQAGLAGQTGQVVLGLQAILGHQKTISVTLSGNLQDPEGLQAGISGDDIAEGRLLIAVHQRWATFDDPEATQAWPGALDSLLAQALDLLKASDMTATDGQFSVALSLTGPAQTRLDIRTDIGAGRTTPDLFNAILPSAL